MQVHRVLTSKADPAVSRLDAIALDAPLAPGQALLAVRRAALTTNNVTYALFGERMKARPHRVGVEHAVSVRPG